MKRVTDLSSPAPEPNFAETGPDFDPLERVIGRLRERGFEPRRVGSQWSAHCPAHEDRRPSLSIAKGKKRTVVVKCHAGCHFDDILKALDLTYSNLCLESRPTHLKNAIKEIYPYVNEHGTLLFEVVRFEPKSFRQRRPNGTGGWTWNLKDVRRVPYRLPQLLAASLQSPILIVEGEKDVATAEEMGFAATCCSGGAGKWSKEFDKYFRNRLVAIVPDNDDAGRRHAKIIAQSLWNVARAIKFVSLPGLPEKGDLTTWVQRGGTSDALRELIEATRNWQPSSEPPPKCRQKTQTQLALELTRKLSLFHTPGGNSESFATIPVESHFENWPIQSRTFRQWLVGEFLRCHDKVLGSQAVQDVLTVLSSRALYEGKEHEIAIRLGGGQDQIYLDLGDKQWRSVRITAEGWSVVPGSEAPIRFVRKCGMSSLPKPLRNGSIDEFRSVINIPHDEDWVLLVGWILAAFRPNAPYPILVVDGEQGSAKSTLCRFVRSLIDPHSVPFRRPPRNEHDLNISASNTHACVFDNVSQLPDWLSDALCCLSTGAGFGARRLFTDGEEALFYSRRPVIVNGIDDLVTRGDLDDRVVHLTMHRILDTDRQQESEIEQRFEEMRPRVLGAFLTAVSSALRMLPSIHLAEVSRMADFCHWVTAAEPALGWPAKTFVKTYGRERKTRHHELLENQVIGPPLLKFLNGRDVWQGTCSDLLRSLEEIVDHKTRNSREWPRTPRGMSSALRRLAVHLRVVGIDVIWGNRARDRSRRRIVTIERTARQPSTPSEPSMPQESEVDGRRPENTRSSSTTSIDGPREMDSLDDVDGSQPGSSEPPPSKRAQDERKAATRPEPRGPSQPPPPSTIPGNRNG